MNKPMYAPTTSCLLTQAQTTQFITELQHAAQTGDVEKAVEHAINRMLVNGLSRIYNRGSVTQDYRCNTDGYISVKNTNKQYTVSYAVLVEAKRDLELSTSRKDRAIVYAQVCAYLRQLSKSGAQVPNVAVICDTDEVFAISTLRLQNYCANLNYAWSQYTPSQMYQDTTLLQDLIDDDSVHNVYVHDITENFDPNAFIWAVDGLGQNAKPRRIPIEHEDRIAEAIDALQDKVSKYSNDYVYVLYWLTGDAQEVYGPNINTAMNNAGIGAGALSALDFYDQGPDTGKYTWDADAREWKNNTE